VANLSHDLHFLSRHRFLAASAGTAASLVFAERLFGAPGETGTKPNSVLEKLAQVALEEAKKQGATYCDIRIDRYRDQFSGWWMSPQRGSQNY
jgi:hypothetical protein